MSVERSARSRRAIGYHSVVCTFLTVATARKNVSALAAALSAAHFDVFPQTNPHVAALFQADETLLLVTRGGCSCDFVPPGPKRNPADQLKRRGLSPGQLARALEATKGERENDNPWPAALDAVLRAHSPVRTFFHMVSGNPGTEAVPDGSRPDVPR